MKRTLMTIAACVVAAVSMNGQLLYKISGNGLEKPSYIIGTHHLANVGFVEKIAGVKQALTDVDQVYGELKWDALTNTDSLKVLQEAMMLPDGKTLKQVLTAEQYKKLDNFLKANPNAKVSITGYADKGTGNATINRSLSQRRAAVVVRTLKEKYGISESRITSDFKGDTEQPFAENNKNRVSICIAQ